MTGRKVDGKSSRRGLDYKGLEQIIMKKRWGLHAYQEL